SFTFGNVAEAPVLSLNRGFSAPVNVVANQSPADLRFLAARDSDPFNRWQAVQTLATSLLIDNVAAIRAQRTPRADDGLLAALTAIVADRGLEPAFVAQALTMPGEADIAREIGSDVDPDAIFLSRQALRRGIGEHLASALQQTHARLQSREPYRPDATSAGRRALKNVCLDLLVATGNPSAVRMAVSQYDDADNMTDRMAALYPLSIHEGPERWAVIEDFYQRFESDPLVIDKWFSLQAMIPEPGALDRIKALTAHPAFSFANPNRLRALIGAFAQANQSQFNRADGAGYDFVADTVLALDQKNPQVAARLLAAFKSWVALEAGRRAPAPAAPRPR